MAKKSKDNVLVKMTSFFFTRWRYTLLLWLLLLGIGTYTYTSMINREGFPPIASPVNFIGGAYPNQSKEAIDEQIGQPLAEALALEEEIDVVDFTATDGSFTAVIALKESAKDAGTSIVDNRLEESFMLPAGAFMQNSSFDPGKFISEFSLIVQVYSTSDASAEQLDEAAAYVASQLGDLESVASVRSIPSIEGEQVQVQTSFSRVALSSAEDSNVAYYNAGTVGVLQSDVGDALDLSDQVSQRLSEIDLSQFGEDYNAIITADFATNIRDDISFLESNMATGLLAVAFVSFLLISWRASLITGLFMVTVMLTTILILWLIGYTLNVITLFALILSLGLFVDDATIAVEAIDVGSKDKKLKPLDVAKEAVRRVGRASLAGTLTTVLVFAILATPTGILGEFIRLIPVTVIVALISSFLLSMTLIPFLAKFLILRDRKVSTITKMNPVLSAEHWLSEKIEKTILSAKEAKGRWLGRGMILVSVAAFFFGVYLLGYSVGFNLFPPSKDANQLGVSVQFTSQLSVAEASEVTEQVDQIIEDTVGEYILDGTYIGDRLPDARSATTQYNIVPFTDRDVTAEEISQRIEKGLEESFTGPAFVAVRPVDNGPPADQFPFGIRVYSDDESVLRAATEDIAAQFVGSEIEDFNGDVISVLDSQIDGLENEILRDNGRRYAITRLAYDSENPTQIALLTEQEFTELYDDESLASLGVDADEKDEDDVWVNVEFDAGQQGDFQDSFNILALSAPVAIVLMFVLLAIQFRSLLQPLLILLAVPFTIFGMAIGLDITSNPFSFFTMVGFIGLIGIAVNNTIMLTDYANQERRAGAEPVEAIAAAAKKRFRPLIATTVTTVVALLPLALSDPFWEALAYTIIFGLISSTIFVLLSFPYYYIATERLRARLAKFVSAVRQKVKS